MIQFVFTRPVQLARSAVRHTDMIGLSVWLQGFVLGLGMFICPDPKEFLILRGLAGRSALHLIGIGTGNDVVLIALGILGLCTALRAAPWLQWGAPVLGIALLPLHGALAARKGFSFVSQHPIPDRQTHRDLAACASFVRLVRVMSLGARRARYWMGSAHAWRLLDAGVALAMMVMALWIACGLYLHLSKAA